MDHSSLELGPYQDFASSTVYVVTEAEQLLRADDITQRVPVWILQPVPRLSPQFQRR